MLAANAPREPAVAAPAVEAAFSDFAAHYCIDCHNPEKHKGKFDLQSLLNKDPVDHIDDWDEILFMLQDREMPPSDEPDIPRPTEDEYASVTGVLDGYMQRLIAAYDQREAGGEPSEAGFLAENCASCHNTEDEKGGLVLEGLTLEAAHLDPELWERVTRRLHARQMPPADRRRRPSEAEYESIVSFLTSKLDAQAQAQPSPGRTETFRRLNRAEYQNAIRDLLGVKIDAAALLPKDEASHGFDNVTVGNLSPTLLNRYISAAQKISRLALGSPIREPESYVYRVPADLTQEKRIEGLPLGTQGGALITHTFPLDGEYEIKIRLSRDRNEEVEGLNRAHQMDVLLDRELVQRFTVTPPEKGQRDQSIIDAHLQTRATIQAGPRQLGVAFLHQPYAILETKREPHSAHFNLHRHPRLSPAVFQISISGPFEADGAGESPSRSKILARVPRSAAEEEPAARDILSRLLQKAYRRPIDDGDLSRPMDFYREGATEGGFEAGIESALAAILVSPEFLFRLERDPEGVGPGEAYPVSDLELASRLSFFLWSSIPDDELLQLAIDGRLSQPEVLEAQARRMLADPRSASLVSNFASQWLYLRNLESISPDQRLFPDFDDNLRHAFRKETELFFESIASEDRSVLELLKADYTFLNERLAEHYGIPHIYGSRFRRVQLSPDQKRGGLLRHGSILTVTSYATRTSPTIRGNWILENIVGTPPPPPPPDVASLDSNTVDANLPMRERLAEHRANPACASCHDLMDPIGFALENFDAVGRWRDFEGGRPVDASGGLPDGATFAGIAKLEEALLNRPELFVRTLSEKLLIFALGRGIDPHDAPAVRQIVREAASQDYRFSSLIIAIVNSDPFRMRAAANPQYTTTPAAK